MDFGRRNRQLGLPLPPSGTDERAMGRVPDVTSDTEARTEEPTETADDGAVDASFDVSLASSVASRFFKVAVGFLALGLLDLVVLAAKRVFPELLGGIAFLSYGRIVPAATTLLLYGWLTIGLLGALLYIVPRAAKADIEDPALAQAGLGLLAVAYLGGAGAVLAGFTEGRRYLESPLVFDLVALVGLLIVARSITRVARKATDASPVVWYSAASVIWLVLTHVAGNIPGLSGYTSQIQTAFYRSSLTGLWIASAAVAVVYYAIPKLAGRPALRGTRLTVLGIWSLGFVWALTGPAELTFGAAGDWLETIGVIFSIVLFLPLVVIVTDLIHGMRGAWSNVRDRASLRFLMVGIVMLGVYALFNLLQSLRASSAVVGFTDWVAALEILLLLGPFTFILIGLMRVAAPDLFGGSAGPSRLGYSLAALGVAITVGAMAIAGLQTGFTWAGAANSAEFVNTGDGWVSTVAPLAGNYVIQLVGLVIAAVGLMMGAVAAIRNRAESLAADPIPAAEPEPELALDVPPSLAKVRRYAFGFFALAALVAFILPALESADPTLFADTNRQGSLAATGRTVYVQEGCTYCHTQQVRPIVTDVGLGPVSVLGDYAKETPVLVGVQRYGPDLMHLGIREADADAIQNHLQSPRETRSWSIMPDYGYLSTDDLAALAVYLVGEE